MTEHSLYNCSPDSYKADLFQIPEQEQDWSKWIVPFRNQLELFVGGVGSKMMTWKELYGGSQ